MALGILLAFGAAFGFGFNQIFVRLATQRISGPATAFFAAATGATMATTLALIFNFEDFKHLPAIAIPWFILLAVLHSPISRVLNFTAISMIGAARAAPMGSFSPLASAILAIAILNERPSLLVYLGTIIVVGGMTLVVTGGMRGQRDRPNLSYNNWGYLMSFGAAAGFGAVSVLAKHINTEFSPPLVTVALSLLIGTFMLSILTHRQVVSSFAIGRRRYLFLSVLSGFCSGFGAICLFVALGRAPVTVVAPIGFAAPLVTLVTSQIFLRRLESINPAIIAGTALSVAGIALVVLGRA